MFSRRLLLFYLLCILVNPCYCDDLYKEDYLWPTVGIAVLVRNKEASLPYFLSCLLQLDYPGDRLYIWIYSDHNEDATLQILEEWTQKYASKYKKVNLSIDHSSSGQKFPDQKNSADWSAKRYSHVIQLREKAFQGANDSWADYIFMLDADVFFTNRNTLKALVKKDLPIVAPMLLTDGLYSNFWGGMSDEYYYRRSDNYEQLIRRKEVGCFNVPMVHSAVLISLKRANSDQLTYDPKKLSNYAGPHDDIITFALSASLHGINMTVCNDELYGFIPIPVDDDLNTEADQVDNVKLETLGRGIDLPLDKHMEKFVKYPKKTKYGLDEVFLINLERRPERKNLMLKNFDTLGLDVKVIKAVDGKLLTNSSLAALSITLMPNYQDPYHKRPMKAGEIGCFLSHFNIWKEITNRNLGKSMVLEDDIHFVPYFEERFLTLMSELNSIEWDIVYMGRKILMSHDEEFVADHITKPRYSYWTLGYLISLDGARKLIKAEPLSKMLPVDEFLPIMFDQHPNKTWKAMFPNRSLNAFSAAPLLVHPTHYTGEHGYVSDTEDSPVASEDTSFTGDRFHRYIQEL